MNCAECQRSNGPHYDGPCVIDQTDCASREAAREAEILEALIVELTALGLRASLEHPDHVSAVDPCGRVLAIGFANGPLEVDVYRSHAAFAAGEGPAESDEVQGDTAGIQVNHCLCVAARVALGERG